MNPMTVLLIIISVIFVGVTALIPLIMSILDPKNIPINLRNYYSSKKTKTTIIFGICALVVVGGIWLFSFCFGLI